MEVRRRRWWALGVLLGVIALWALWALWGADSNESVAESAPSKRSNGSESPVVVQLDPVRPAASDELDEEVREADGESLASLIRPYPGCSVVIEPDERTTALSPGDRDMLDHLTAMLAEVPAVSDDPVGTYGIGLAVAGGHVWCIATGDVPEEWWEITGFVETESGAPVSEALVSGCGGRRQRVEPDGSFRLLVESLDCEVRAVRIDGAFVARAEAWVDEDTYDDVALVLPDFRLAGMGMGIEEIDEGIGVTRVLADTPAWDAGLVEGDIVVAVDGVPTVELSVWEFIELGTGEEGTEVELELLGDTGIEVLTLVRELVD